MSYEANLPSGVMQQLIRWDLCRFVKTLAYFGVVPLIGETSWLQRLFGLPASPSAPQSQAMSSTARTVLVLADESMTGLLDQALTQQGYHAHPLPLGSLSEAIAQLPEAVLTETVGAIGILNPDIAPTLRPEVANLLAQSPPRRRTLFDFRQLRDLDLDPLWGPVDDVVMGGISESSIECVATGALFSGTVSTENSGGFASVRTRNLDPIDMSNYEGVQLRVRGDGNRYKFLLRDSDRWDGVAYSASFDTLPNEWITVQIPFDDLVPVFRARTLEESDSINRKSVRAFQIMLSKFEYDGGLNPTFEPGPFALLIDSIEAYNSAPPVAVWLLPSTTPAVTPEPKASEVIICAASLQPDSPPLLTLAAEPSGPISPSMAVDLCVQALTTPKLRHRAVAVHTGTGHSLQQWPKILADLDL